MPRPRGRRQRGGAGGSEVIFCTRHQWENGFFQELVITDDDQALYISGEPSKRRSTRHIERPRREVHEFLWEVDGILRDWEQLYGPPEPRDAATWQVILAMRNRLRRWKGTEHYPPGWEEFCELVAGFIKAPFA